MTETPKDSNVHRLTPASTSLPNPFRPNCMKARCYERFQQGGDTASILRDMEKLGAAGTTARTWLCTFRMFVRGARAVQKQSTEQKGGEAK